MKTSEISSSSDWTFKRALKISIQSAVIYAVLSVIWILVMGNKPEVVCNVRLTDNIASVYALPWDSWFNILPNFIGIILFGIAFFAIVRFIQSLKPESIDWAIGLVLGLGSGISAGVVYELPLGLPVALSSLLIGGIMIGACGTLAEILGSGLNSAWSFLIYFGLISGSTFGLLFTGFTYGAGISLIIGLFMGLGAILVLGFFVGLAWIIEQLFSKKFWTSLRKRMTLVRIV
jgi:hypothetical protein